MRVILVFLFFIFTQQVLSQDTLYKISGKVIDDKTKQPIANVGVQIYGTLWGAATDSNGFFKLSVKENAVLLKFLIVGYEDKIIKISSKNYTGFVVALSQKTQQLKEIVINGSPIEAVIKSEDSNVLDYDFYDDNILMITYRNDLSKAKLFLLSPSFDTLSRLKLPAEPTELYKDCLGNNHVVCQNDVYQIYLDSTLNLKLLTPKDIKTFAAMLYPCVAEDSLNLYIIKKQGSELVHASIGADYYSPNHTLDYFAVNKLNRQVNHLINVADERSKRYRDDEAFAEANKMAAGMYAHGGGPQQDRYFLEKIVIKEVFAPLYNINGIMYVFDFINLGILNFSSSGQLQNKVEMKFQLGLNFKREMCIDKKTGKAFAVFETDGVTEIKEMNLNTGNINQTYKVPYPFIKKIKAYDNYIYFLYKGNQDLDTRFLSRLKLN